MDSEEWRNLCEKVGMASGSKQRVISDGNSDDDDDDDSCSEDGTSEGNLSLKKGPWSPVEDTILMDYVSKHGEGNWNAVRKHTELARCGKSCRLRWANHLRPDLKKGPFSVEEERLIIELHAKWGNKWARMAIELPGRTDNEIKNFWNTRIKRLHRTGQPIYPPDVCIQASNENQQINDTHYPVPDFIPKDDFKIPQFKGFKIDDTTIDRFPVLNIPLELTPSNQMAEATMLNPKYSNVHQPLLPTVHQFKRLRLSDPLLQGSNASMGYMFAPEPQFNNSMQTGKSLLLPSGNNNYNHLVVDQSMLSDNNRSLNPFGAADHGFSSMETQTVNGASSLANCNPIGFCAQCSTSSEKNRSVLDMYLSSSEVESSKGTAGVTTQPTNNLPESGWEMYGGELTPLCPTNSLPFSMTTPSSERWEDQEEANFFGTMNYDSIIPQQHFSVPPSNCFCPSGYQPTDYESFLNDDMFNDDIAGDGQDNDNGQNMGNDPNPRP